MSQRPTWGERADQLLADLSQFAQDRADHARATRVLADRRLLLKSRLEQLLRDDQFQTAARLHLVDALRSHVEDLSR